MCTVAGCGWAGRGLPEQGWRDVLWGELGGEGKIRPGRGAGMVALANAISYSPFLGLERPWLGRSLDLHQSNCSCWDFTWGKGMALWLELLSQTAELQSWTYHYVGGGQKLWVRHSWGGRRVAIRCLTLPCQEVRALALPPTPTIVRLWNGAWSGMGKEWNGTWGRGNSGNMPPPLSLGAHWLGPWLLNGAFATVHASRTCVPPAWQFNRIGLWDRSVVAMAAMKSSALKMLVKQEFLYSHILFPYRQNHMWSEHHFLSFPGHVIPEWPSKYIISGLKWPQEWDFSV